MLYLYTYIICSYTHVLCDLTSFITEGRKKPSSNSWRVIMDISKVNVVVVWTFKSKNYCVDC